MRISRVGAVLAAGVTAAALLAGPPAVAGGTSHTGHSQAVRNGLIAFQAEVGGGVQIFTVRPDGTGLRQLTHVEGAEAETPDWSPDGRHIVFGIANESGGDLYVMNADGSNRRMLPGLRPPGGWAGQPSYSPDGREVFYQVWDGDWVGTFRARLSGGKPRQVTYPPTGYHDAAQSVAPDGRTMSFVRVRNDDDAQAALFTIDLRMSKEKQLTPFGFNVAVKQSWSPDGRRIVFSRDYHLPQPGISGNVTTIAPSGRHLRSVTTYAGGEVHAAAGTYSPDGRWIVFREQGPDRSRLMVVHPDGSGARSILEVPGLVPRFIDWGSKAH